MDYLFYLIIIVIYLFPSLIAYKRSHLNMDAILILNLFLGWTFLGWVIALVWAFTNREKSFA